MTAPTDSDLAYQLIGALEPLGAQWAQLEDAVRGRPGSAHALLDEFGEQLAEIVRLGRLAAQRLAKTEEA